jgi:spermidine dehydrogenase
MSPPITRREFIDGFACAVAAAALPASAGVRAGGYPPGLTGLRGSRPEDLAVAHGVRDGTRYKLADYGIEEHVELAVVGAGLGGLTAAYRYQRERPRARILILDNHDDFGGHARRNEFSVDGRLLIGYGGSESIQSPFTQWPSGALGELKSLGISIERLGAALDGELYPGRGLSSGLLFQRETFGVDKLVTGDPQRSLPTDVPAARHHARPIGDFVADFPLSAPQKEILVALYESRRDVLKGKTRAQKRELLRHVSYLEFLRRYWGLDETSLKLFRGRTFDLFAAPADTIAALDAADCEYPGLAGLKLGAPGEMGYEREPYIYHFPDGNAGIARMLVRALVPGVAPGRSMEDSVTAPFDYGRLDSDANPARIRLASTVVHLANAGAEGVDLLYLRAGTVHRVRAKRAIYSGYETMLPYICPELGTAQREAVAACVKAPLVYVNVVLRNWQAFVRQGVHNINNPAGFYPVFKLDYPVSLGDYRCAQSPEEPIVVHMVHIPRAPGLLPDRRLMLRAARGVLYGMEFSEFEAHAREELTRALGPGGFDAERDIAAITVNRWGHGYAYDINMLYDAPEDRALMRRGRQPIGRIGIAGSDAAWSAYAHDAIETGRLAALNALATG